MRLGGAGLLYTTEVTRADLGRHAGRHLWGRAERRTLRLALGEGRGLRLYASRLRPVAIEVTDADDHRYELPIPPAPDPRFVAVGHIIACWAIASAVLSAARLLRAKIAAS